MEPLFATFEEKGHFLLFLDDLFVSGEKNVINAGNVVDIVQLLRPLGFIIHPYKPILELARCI